MNHSAKRYLPRSNERWCGILQVDDNDELHCVLLEIHLKRNHYVCQSNPHVMHEENIYIKAFI